MVLLTMTSLVVEALKILQDSQTIQNTESPIEESESTPIETEAYNEDEEHKKQMRHIADGAGPKAVEQLAARTLEPSLVNPQVGNAITHGQIMDLAQELKSRGRGEYRLESLLNGSRVYMPPRQAKAEPTSEYKALMAKLRREEEERSYHRMINPPPPMETFAQRFPSTSAAHAFSSNHPEATETPEDEVTYADIDRQVALIFNVLVSIIACAAAIWVAARWWSTPMRLALSMSGSLLVGVAEVVVYAGYIRRVGEAKGKEKGLREIKEVVNTWIVGSEEAEKESIAIDPKVPDNAMARKRK